MEGLCFISFSSGSNGNCYYLGTRSHGILIDAGISLRKLRSSMTKAGLSTGMFSSIIITHDHSDHMRHLGSYCKHLGKKVYATAKLHEALARNYFTRNYISSFRADLREDEWNEVDGFRVHPFEVPHDSTQTMGYAIEYGEHKFVIMTDIGHMTDDAIEFAKVSQTVVIESNYDVEMLAKGPYPQNLKVRIRDGHGHLSNDECADAIRDFCHEGLKHIFLCHLSEHNNTPQKAYDCSYKALTERGFAGSVRLLPLPRTESSQLFEL